MDLPDMNDFLMGREKEYPLSGELLFNARKTLEKVQELLSHFGEYRRISSGYRPPAINAQVANAKKDSKHQTCQACDLEDIDGKLNQYCKDNETLLEILCLWCEERQGGWQHIQTIPPRSGKRWFNP